MNEELTGFLGESTKKICGGGSGRGGGGGGSGVRVDVNEEVKLL